MAVNKQRQEILYCQLILGNLINHLMTHELILKSVFFLANYL